MTAVAFDPTLPEQRENPFSVLELARREQPVFYAEKFGLWIVTRHDDVLAVLKDHRSFSSEGALKSSPGAYPPAVQAVLAEGFPEMPYIIEVDRPVHDRIRGLITKAFTPRRVAELAPRIEEIARELVDTFAADGEGDIVERFAWPLPLRVLGELFGVPRDELEQLHHWGMDWLLVQQELPVERRVEHARGLVQMQRYFVELVEQRIAEPTDDLVGALVSGRNEIDPPLSVIEIAGLPLDLMVAGHVTVTRAIGSTLNRLFAHPPLREHLLDPVIAPKAIEEILRLEAPAQGLFRIAARDVEIGGVTLPRGARVMAHFASANRDDCVFAQPDDYEPERADIGKHLAFGKGIHFCIGAPLARLELGVALPLLLERLPGLRPGAEAGEREEIFFARGFRRLPVRWDPA
ncbi:MAG TPA: cytochrome P450 [Gaiellaceae bacterium]|jgi:cytochrome P450|nr:cytochrome P450 [Gaiellaceae bacterium]